MTRAVVGSPDPEKIAPAHCTGRTCQFPEGDPRDPANFRFCGAPVTQRRTPSPPYCDACRAKAYQGHAVRPVLRKSTPRLGRAEPVS
jgi:hypothetical protein